MFLARTCIYDRYRKPQYKSNEKTCGVRTARTKNCLVSNMVSKQRQNDQRPLGQKQKDFESWNPVKFPWSKAFTRPLRSVVANWAFGSINATRSPRPAASKEAFSPAGPQPAPIGTWLFEWVSEILGQELVEMVTVAIE